MLLFYGLMPKNILHIMHVNAVKEGKETTKSKSVEYRDAIKSKEISDNAIVTLQKPAPKYW